ncbi:MAG: ArsR/SmtB family transcription factor [Anaerolineales bacterium]
MEERRLLLEDETAERLAGIFKALSDPTRVQIIAALIEGEHCVSELAAGLAVSQSAVSHQLRSLREMRLVRSTREGRHVRYALDDAHIADLFLQAWEHVRHE